MTKVTTPLQGGIFTPRHVRLLKMSVAIMTTLLILGIIALVFGVVRQASKLGTAPKPAAASTAQSPYVQSFELGQGKLEGIAASGDFLILHWKGDASDTIITVDPRNGHEMGRIRVSQH